MKRILKVITLLLLSMGFISGHASSVLAVESEDFDMPIIVLGEQLSEGQKEEVRRLLEVEDSEDVKEYIVTGQDYANYIDGSPDSNMYSSVKIVRQKPGKGLTIHIVTADNITQVTTEMYANALLTAGVENAIVEVASPIQVTGHSALTGIYKAYDAEGEILDKERMEVANEELDVATDLVDKDGMSQEKVSELLAEIKKAIADQNPATKEDIEKIVKEQLDKLEVNLSDADRQLLIDLFEKMRELDIDFDQVKKQLEDIASTIKDKIDDLGIEIDENFWQKVGNFFKELFNALGSFFDGILD